MNIRISWLWLLFLPAFLMQHMGKTLFFLFLMLTIHEGAHMLVAKLFGYPIEGVIIYPFGLCARMKYLGMGSVGKELLIIMAGPAMHFLFPYLFDLLVHMSIISQAYMDYLCMLNRSILVFNLLPVYPLDGGRIVQSLYHLVFRYTTAQRLTLITGGMNLFLLWWYRILTTPSAMLVMLFLFLQIIMAWKQIGIERLHFYHYRKTHPSRGPLRSNCKADLYRAYTNMMKTDAGWMLEEDWLQCYFHETLPHTLYSAVL